MKNKLWIWIVLFGYNLCYGQTEIILKYFGPVGHIDSGIVQTNPNSLWQVDFIAYTVSDDLILCIGNDTLHFNVGSNSGKINSFSEFYYDGNIDTLCTSVNCVPSDFYLNIPIGMMRLNFLIPDTICKFAYYIIGNHFISTLYDARIRLLVDGEITENFDTINVCENKQDTFYFKNCQIQHIHYNNKEIIEQPIIHNASCIERNDGWTEFDNKDYNQYALPYGINNFAISNGVCSKDYVLFVDADHSCTNYIPNVFSPNGDGINDMFMMFTRDLDLPYNLSIYDRWGSIVYNNKNAITNETGWNGIGFNPNIYVYKIVCGTELYSGTISLIK